MGGATIIIWILVFFGIFYFLAIRPQRRQRQQHSEMVSMLKKGDEVVTIGGMFGTITAIGDDWVELEVAKRTRVRYLKRAISSITSIDEYDEDEEDEYIEAADEDVTEDADEEYVEDDEAVEAERTRPPTRTPTLPTPRRLPRRDVAVLGSDQDAACDDGPRRRCGARRHAGILACGPNCVLTWTRHRGNAHMAHVIAFANQKGGVAKTTSTVNLGAALREHDLRVLAVDMDPQGNLTMSQGIDTEGLDKSMYDVLVHRTPIEDVIYERELDVAASTIDLAGAEMALATMIGRERALQRALDAVREQVRLHPHRHAAVARAAHDQRADGLGGRHRARAVRVPLAARSPAAREDAGDDPGEPQPGRAHPGHPADAVRRTHASTARSPSRCCARTSATSSSTPSCARPSSSPRRP